MSIWKIVDYVAETIAEIATWSPLYKKKKYKKSSGASKHAQGNATKPPPKSSKSHRSSTTKTASPETERASTTKTATKSNPSAPPNAPARTTTKPPSNRPKVERTVARTSPPSARTSPVPPSTPQVEIGARSFFQPKAINAQAVECGCTPLIPDCSASDLEIHLGIDFGTRYTKICFRDSDTQRTRAVTFDREASDLQRSLIPSQLALLNDGAVLTGLTEYEWRQSQWPIEKTIDFIKMRLAYLDLPQEDINWPPPVAELDSPEAIENLSAYFLAFLIARSRQWIQVSYPDLFKNRTPLWILQVGAPVEYWQGSAIDRFQQVLKLAWAFSFTPSMQNRALLTLPQLNTCMGHVRNWVRENPDLDCLAKPEIAAAVWSHIRAAGSREGFYVFFDVGDGTTEGAAFNFGTETGERQITFYSGFVQPLGVSALIHQMSCALDIAPDKIEALFREKRDFQIDAVSKQLHRSKQRKHLQQLVGRVVVRGCKEHKKFNPTWKSNVGENLQIFMGGGGGQIQFYQQAVSDTYKDFQHRQAGIKPYQLRSIPRPSDLDMQALRSAWFHRYAVAYGLTIPDGEFPEFLFPNEEDAPGPPPPSRGSPDKYDDTKDLC